MSLDLSNDWQLIDDPVTVTLRPKTGEGVWAAGAAVTDCQRAGITQEDAETVPALLLQEGAVFHLWTAKLFAVVPKLGDKVVHGVTVWLVQVVGKFDRDANGVQRYRLTCLRSNA